MVAQTLIFNADGIELTGHGSNSTLTCTHAYSQIALTVTHAITDCTRTRKSTDYCPNCTRKCVINYTNGSYTAGITKVYQSEQDIRCSAFSESKRLFT